MKLTRALSAAIVAVLLIASAQANAQTEETFAEISYYYKGMGYRVRLTNAQGNCEKNTQVAYTDEGHVFDWRVRDVGCWILMPHHEIHIVWKNLATGRQSATATSTLNLFTFKEPEYWWQFTPGFDELMKKMPSNPDRQD